MQISKKRSKINFCNFLWHAVFFAIASNFMDIDTIIPSMLIKAGATPVHLGFLTAIMIGGSQIFQLIFASNLSKKKFKKKYLLAGINIRVFSLLALALLFYYSIYLSGNIIILLIFILISVFALSGSYSAISYNDILGKTVRQEKRKYFFSMKQMINSIFVFASALIVRDLVKRFEYPKNYSILFLIAGMLLFIASLGFWNIKENYAKTTFRKNIFAFFRLIPSEIKKNSNLMNFLLIINSLGLGISLLPFLIIFAKEKFGLTYEMIGNFLLLRIIGMIIASLFFYKTASKIEYKILLKISLIIGAILPIIALFLGEQQFLYQFIFIFSGIFISMFRISKSGVLLEISTNENRALYTGIAGAGNILNTVFPIAAGFLITALGYVPVFIAVSFLVLLSFFFVNKLSCKKVQ